MKMGIYSARTMDGPLTAADRVLTSRRPLPMVLRPVQFNLQEHALQGSRLWYLKACSLSGLMRMVLEELKLLNPPCKISSSWGLFACLIHVVFVC